jgi:hypothetical protein
MTASPTPQWRQEAEGRNGIFLKDFEECWWADAYSLNAFLTKGLSMPSSPGWPHCVSSKGGLSGRPPMAASKGGLRWQPLRSASDGGLSGRPPKAASQIGLQWRPLRSASDGGLSGRSPMAASQVGL